MPAAGLAHVVILARTETNLCSGVTVLFGRLDLCDSQRPGNDKSRRRDRAFLVEDLRHPTLGAEHEFHGVKKSRASGTFEASPVVPFGTWVKAVYGRKTRMQHTVRVHQNGKVKPCQDRKSTRLNSSHS